MKIFKILLVALIVSMFSVTTFAHTKLKSSEPADKSVIKTSISELKLVFNGKVKLMKVQLKTTKGEKVKLAMKVSPIASDTFIIPLPKLSQDNYVVSWMAMGKDSHKMKGEFFFTISDEKQSVSKN